MSWFKKNRHVLMAVFLCKTQKFDFYLLIRAGSFSRILADLPERLLR